MQFQEAFVSTDAGIKNPHLPVEFSRNFRSNDRAVAKFYELLRKIGPYVNRKKKRPEEGTAAAKYGSWKWMHLEDALIKLKLLVSTTGKRTFSDFIAGQTAEACILGLLCIVGMEIFGFPYALEVGVLVTVTAFIPVIGAFVGAAAGAFFIMFISFEKALWFLLFMAILQQLEDNLIYPRVVGRSVGLPPLWVLLAVTVGGSAGGILGMFISVPVCSVLYCLAGEVLEYLEERQRRKE